MSHANLYIGERNSAALNSQRVLPWLELSDAVFTKYTIPIFKLNRFQRRQAKKLAEKKQKQAVILPAGIVPSAWSLIEAEFMKRRPWLCETLANQLRRDALPIYSCREGNIQLF